MIAVLNHGIYFLKIKNEIKILKKQNFSMMVHHKFTTTSLCVTFLRVKMDEPYDDFNVNDVSIVATANEGCNLYLSVCFCFNKSMFPVRGASKK